MLECQFPPPQKINFLHRNLRTISQTRSEDMLESAGVAIATNSVICDDVTRYLATPKSLVTSKLARYSQCVGSLNCRIMV